MQQLNKFWKVGIRRVRDVHIRYYMGLNSVVGSSAAKTKLGNTNDHHM